MTVYYTYCISPLGPLLMTSNGAALTGLYMEEHRHGPQIGADWVEASDTAPFAEVRQQMTAYFAGERREFDLLLAPIGTEFQQQVWTALSQIPYGVTISYGELARRIGNPNASRAVGLANGRNPISIVVPCHRVIGASGKLTGYGGGMARKEVLLALEQAAMG
jgi:methylated-DNA-[protein]-cysteine S-methyltransferase